MKSQTFQKMNSNKEIEIAIRAAYLAGNEIMKVYDTVFEVEHKSDNSPITKADRNAHLLIKKALEETNLPFLSEEGRDIPFSERKDWDQFWMVDPLDGTKEFVKRNGEFTVNIARIRKNNAEAGIIYVPVTGVMYFGASNIGAFKMEEFNAENLEQGLQDWIDSAERLPASKSDRTYTVVGSRSHKSDETAAFMEKLRSEHGNFEVISMGSSLKICLVAEGVADIYPRFAPTMEWDTAAGHGIVRAAGKEIIDYATQAPMVYNKENLMNNWFIVE